MIQAFLVVGTVLCGVNGLPEAIHESGFIARVHVDKTEKVLGRYAQRATVSVTDVLRGGDEKTLSVLARDQGFSGVELTLVDGADELVFLRKETVDGKEEWILVEGFLITRAGMVTLGDGSSTWWVMKPMALADARAHLVKAISDDNKLPRTPLTQPKSGVRKDPGH